MACPQGQMWLPHPVSGELASRIAGVETARRTSQSPQGVSQPGTCILPFLPRHCAHLCPATPERPCGPGSLLSPGKAGGAHAGPALPAACSGPHCPLCLQRLTAIRQVLGAQKISFLLRGGVRVLVAERAADTGESEPCTPRPLQAVLAASCVLWSFK